MTRSLLVLAVLLVAGCSTVTVNIPVMKPAEINVARYKQLGVDQLQNDRNGEITGLLKSALVESNRFTILDRENLDKITKEQRFAASGAATGDNVKLGQQLIASALILGNVTHHDYKENMEKYEYDTKDSKGNISHHVSYTRRGAATVRVSLQVTDVTTGQVIKSKNLEYIARESTHATDEYPAQLNHDAMFQDARNKVVNAFVLAITPHKVNMEVAFQKDGKLPQLEQAINMVKAGQYPDAEKIVSEAIDLAEKSGLPSKIVAKAYWDRGLIYEYSGQFEPARADVKKAYQFEADEDYLAELNRITTREADEKKLKDQGVTPEGQSETAGKGEI